MLKPDTPVQYLKGIGPKRAAKLTKLGIETVEDLLFHLPHRYIDRSNPVPMVSTQIGQEATLVVKVLGVTARRTRRGPMVQILVGDGSAQMYVVFFNRPDLRTKFTSGETILLSGQVTFYGDRQMVNPFFEKLDENPDFFANPIFPVYPLTEGLAAWEVRRAVGRALDEIEELVETLPDELLKDKELPGIADTLQRVHRPARMQDVEAALHRMRYEELFYFQMLIALRRRSYEAELRTEPLQAEGELISRFIDMLPFELTADQRKVMAEIARDVARERPMHRLLQGDVGAGKTVVAVYAMLAAFASGKQAAMMAPTEILAEQHYEGWAEMLEGIGVKPVLLTGSLPAAEKDGRRAMIAAGEADVVFGTHALIEESVEFKNLGLTVVDEQHRFGVMQRAKLSEKGELKPHVLVMSATPIPRTLTLSYYGDLDVSVIKEKPKGRAGTKTELTSESHKEGVYKWLAESLGQGDRAFVVCPLIEESEKLELSSAKETFDELVERLGARRVALIHGRMKTRERTSAMERFRTGEIDVLVSTTVIEVGVDVPEASVMIIRHPERFGLAQLHQLRGRIGRGERPSRCVLLASDELSPEARQRLAFFARNPDGFILAEEDLRIRGPGQIMGTRQHGLPDLQIADLVRDRDILVTARQDAFAMLARDPELAKHPRVSRTIKRRYRRSLELLGIA